MPASLCIYEVGFNSTAVPIDADKMQRDLDLVLTPMERGFGNFVIATAQNADSLTYNLHKEGYTAFEVRQIRAADVNGQYKYASLRQQITAIVNQWKGPKDF